jgi:hypothetical protein
MIHARNHVILTSTLCHSELAKNRGESTFRSALQLPDDDSSHFLAQNDIWALTERLAFRGGREEWEGRHNRCRSHHSVLPT